MNRWQRTLRSGILATALVLVSAGAGPVAEADRAGADGPDHSAHGPHGGIHLHIEVRIPGLGVIWPGWCPTPTPTPT
ncbi:hypothetical protein, partial [Streptomyces milbemycinicus]|uniref:hypothetical protein n=1 Tax=Streptomyces milbemycinicus TaxID=476552 RepID=UPI001B8079A6